MRSLSWEWIIVGIVAGMAILAGAALLWYSVAVVLPAQQNGAGEWNQIAIAYNNGGQLYWNGTAVGGVHGKGNLATNSPNLIIGNEPS